MTAQSCHPIVGDFNDAIGALVPLLVAGFTSCSGALDQIAPPHCHRTDLFGPRMLHSIAQQPPRQSRDDGITT